MNWYNLLLSDYGAAAGHQYHGVPCKRNCAGKGTVLPYKGGPCEHFCGKDASCCKQNQTAHTCNGHEGGDHVFECTHHGTPGSINIAIYSVLYKYYR